MRKKPKGARYRNLFVRGPTIFFEQHVRDRRVRFTTKTDDWDVAAQVRDLWEEKTGNSQVPVLEVPTFAELAAKYLETMNHLAETTRSDRTWLLRPDGPLTAYFGALCVDAVRRATLLDWWQSEIEGTGRAPKTGRNHLDALAAVFAVAVDREILEANPVDAFRVILRRRNRTARGRAASEPGKHVQPIEDPTDVDAFVEASRHEGGLSHLVNLLCLDAGLRLGEATALSWNDVWWGRDANDTTRALTVRASLSRGQHLGKTKSGRTRKVALSRRLRAALLEHWLQVGRPESGPVALVDHRNHRRRAFGRACRAAGVGPRSPKDLRDTFASQLLTAGIQLGYLSAQLGHADVAVTARHYARWAAVDSWRRPMEVSNGEVPADLLARLEPTPVRIPSERVNVQNHRAPGTRVDPGA